MPLVSMTTNLKSLRFGNDTVGGGNSNQPYIVTPIPEKFSDIGRTGGPDFLLRGGTLLPKVTVQDTSRLFKMFFKSSSPAGPLFIVKQNVLSLSNVNSGTGYISFDAYNGIKTGNLLQRTLTSIGNFISSIVPLNQGIYTPLSTLGQAAGNSLGIHLNKQGINPFRGTTKGSVDGNTPLGLPTYLNIIAAPENKGNKSRLLGLTEKINVKQTDTVLYRYSGGPGAILGVGRTTINMVNDQRTGINNFYNSQLAYTSAWGNNLTFTTRSGGAVDVGNITLVNFNTSNQNITDVSSTTQSTSKVRTKIVYAGSQYVPSSGKSSLSSSPINIPNIQIAYGASIKYFSTLSSYKYDDAQFNNNWLNVSGDISPLNPSVYQPGGGLVTNTVGNKLNSGVGNIVPTQVFTQAEINSHTPSSREGGNWLESFTKTIAPEGSPYIPNTLDYVTQNIEDRVKLGNPGKRGNLTSYVVGKLASGSSADQGEAAIKANSGYKNAADQVNAFPLYQTIGLPPAETNDLVKFRIGVLDNDNPNKKTYIHFRAFIDSFSDQYTSDWDAKKFMGRGESFYKYNGFDRTISLSWTVAAQSKQELIPMYQKLNYLASVCAPDYSDAGYMRGNLISLTMGGYCYEQVGIMKGITLDVPGESPWEIGISDGFITGSNSLQISSDPSVKELPMIIKVTGFTFVPIHDFVPRVQQNAFVNKGETDATNFISSYGKERYISLAAAKVDNYSGGKAEGATNGNINYIP
jgi:hypothetical protein